jgi:hypothetical protein
MRSSCAALAGAAPLAAGSGHARAQGASFALENDYVRVNRNAAPCVAAVGRAVRGSGDHCKQCMNK